MWPGLRPPEISDSTSATATAANSSGTQMPSLRPLSTLSPWRIRCGTRGSVTTACPSAASVGASTTARITASPMLSSPKIAAAATAPSAMVSGRPMPSSRTGTSTVRRSAPRSMREASANSTSASVVSASAAHGRARARQVDPVEHLGPDQQPEGDEQDRRRDRRPRQPPRDRGDAEQRERHEGEGPLHVRASCQSHATRSCSAAAARPPLEGEACPYPTRAWSSPPSLRRSVAARAPRDYPRRSERPSRHWLRDHHGEAHASP